MSDPVSQAAHPTESEFVAAPAGRSRLAVALNLLGFALGLALLWWCGVRALSPENSEQLRKLAAAPWWQAGSLVALSLLSAVFNSLAFHAAVSPVRRLPVLDVVAINFIASLGNYMPFKLGLIFRILTHNRRNGVPLLTIGAWMGAMAVIMLCVLGPVLFAGVWRGRVDAAWWLASVGGITLLCGAVIGTATFAGTGRGWTLITWVWKAVPMPRRLRDSAMLDRIHEGTRMLGSPAGVLRVVMWRLADLVVQSARFMVAAAIVGRAIRWDESLLAGSTYYLIGSVSPAGQLGLREAGTAGLIGKVLAGVDFDAFSLIVLMVTAAELIAFLLGGAVSLAYLARSRSPVAAPPAARGSQETH